MAVAFHIVAEFAIHEAAGLGFDAITKKAEKFSAVAKTSLDQIQGMTTNLIMNMTGATGGLIGIFSKAIQVSDKFTHSQLDIARTFAANRAFFTGLNGWTDELALGGKLLEQIADDAERFSLPEGPLIQNFKAVLNLLAPKGLAGKDAQVARDISRTLLKSAPSLGIDPALIQGQLFRTIRGAASMGDPLFGSLITEAPEIFEEAGVKGAKDFNLLTAKKRVDLLVKSLNKFSSITEELDMRTKTMSATWQRLMNILGGVRSILKPIGDVIKPLVVGFLNDVADILHKHVRPVVETLGGLAAKHLSDWKGLVINLMQFSRAAGDLVKAGTLTAAAVGLMYLKETLMFFQKFAWFQNLHAFLVGVGVQVPILGKVGRLIAGIVGKLAIFVGAGGILAVIGKGLFIFTGFFLIFQAISRAMAKLKVKALLDTIQGSKVYAEFMEKLHMLFVIIKEPFSDFIEGLSELIVLLLGGGTSGLINLIILLTAIIDGVLFFAKALSLAYTIFKAFTGFLMELFLHLRKWRSGYQDFGDAKYGITSSFEEALKQITEKKSYLYGGDEAEREKSAMNVEQNIGKVEVRQDFKERQEPDRVAFAVKDLLENIANNRREAAGAPGFTSPTRATGAVFAN